MGARALGGGIVLNDSLRNLSNLSIWGNRIVGAGISLNDTCAGCSGDVSGVIASCVSTYAAHVSRVDVATDGGKFGLEPALYYHGIKGFRSDAKPFAFPDIDQFAAEMDDFAICVRDGKPTRVPGEEGLRDVRIIDALYRSAAAGRDVKLT